MTFKVRITGGPETAAALRLLGRGASSAKALRDGLRPGAEMIADDARSNVPVVTGALQRSIVVRTRATRGSFAGGLIVGHTKNDHSQRWRISHLVEYGTRHSSARPYMRPALASNGQNAIVAFGHSIWHAIALQLTKVRSKAAIRGGRA